MEAVGLVYNIKSYRMKRRILTGWNFRRLLYVALGIAVIAESVSPREWMGILLGGYFAAMGLFAFGCASGNCYGGACNTPMLDRMREADEVHYTEIK